MTHSQIKQLIIVFFIAVVAILLVTIIDKLIQKGKERKEIRERLAREKREQEELRERLEREKREEEIQRQNYIKAVKAESRDLVYSESLRFADLQALKRNYFFTTFKTSFHFLKTLDTKQKYDRVNWDDFFEDVVSHRQKQFDEILTKIQTNRNLKRMYDDDVSRLHPFADSAWCAAHDVPYDIYHGVEVELCVPPARVTIPDLEIVLEKEYISPQGQKRYCEIHKCSEIDFRRAVATLKKREEQQNSKQYQRSKMTNSLRYDVMKRDGFRCVLCGRTARDGIVLHVDHIVPIAKGGKTEMSNLRTLCNECNHGKASKYDAGGVN